MALNPLLLRNSIWWVKLPKVRLGSNAEHSRAFSASRSGMALSVGKDNVLFGSARWHLNGHGGQYEWANAAQHNILSEAFIKEQIALLETVFSRTGPSGD